MNITFTGDEAWILLNVLNNVEGYPYYGLPRPDVSSLDPMCMRLYAIRRKGRRAEGPFFFEISEDEWRLLQEGVASLKAACTNRNEWHAIVGTWPEATDDVMSRLASLTSTT